MMQSAMCFTCHLLVIAWVIVIVIAINMMNDAAVTGHDEIVGVMLVPYFM